MERGSDLGRVRVERELVATDAYGLSRDPGGGVRGEEHDERGAVLGHADGMCLADLTGQRLAGLDGLDKRCVDRDRGGHLRPGRGDDRVDGDLGTRNSIAQVRAIAVIPALAAA